MNLHHQHQYSEDREEEKMNINEMNFNSRLTILNDEFQSKLEALKVEYEEFKKAEESAEVKEVKPVFPENGYRCNPDGAVLSVSNSSFDWLSVGEIFHTVEEAKQNHERKKARKHIIEEINKANKGDNGFKDEDNANWYIKYCPHAEMFAYQVSGYQTMEPGFYMREKPSDDFIADLIPYYKIVFGVES